MRKENNIIQTIFLRKNKRVILFLCKKERFSTEADVGETRIFVARVYAYNKSNVKGYSVYSNELVISNN